MEFKEKIIKAEYSKLRDYFSKINPSWFLIFLTIIFFVWAGTLFYQYILAAPPPLLTEELKININLYNRVMKNLKARPANIQEGTTKNYPDVFR